MHSRIDDESEVSARFLLNHAVMSGMKTPGNDVGVRRRSGECGMEVMLPTAVGGAFAFAGALAYGASQPGQAAPAGRKRRTDGKVDLRAFAPADVFAHWKKVETPLAAGAKRLADISLASALLILASPICLIVAIAIALETPGPVFYRQTRVGAGGRTFQIVKFRSMRQDAERDGAQWASEKDPRVTRIGRLIRHLRIDEIPQAFNVLAGDMSFVGPRPERPEFVEVLNAQIPHYDMRHMVKPGITGWAQVKCSYGASVEDAMEKHRFDLYYLKNYNLLMDIKIVLMTFRVALFGVGSR